MNNFIILGISMKNFNFLNYFCYTSLYLKTEDIYNWGIPYPKNPLHLVFLEKKSFYTGISLKPREWYADDLKKEEIKYKGYETNQYRRITKLLYYNSEPMDRAESRMNPRGGTSYEFYGRFWLRIAFPKAKKTKPKLIENY